MIENARKLRNSNPGGDHGRKSAILKISLQYLEHSDAKLLLPKLQLSLVFMVRCKPRFQSTSDALLDAHFAESMLGIGKR